MSSSPGTPTRRVASAKPAPSAAPTPTPPSALSQFPTGAFPSPLPGILDFGTVNILAGASGVGKTCLLSTILAALSRGKPVFGVPSHAPTQIGFLCADRGGATALHWLTQAGYTDLTFYSLVEDANFNPASLRNKFQLVALLERLILSMALAPGALLVVDPLTLFLGNPNDYQTCAIACIEIRRMCIRHQLTMIGTAHASKQKADHKSQYKRLQDRILGSAAQLGYGDTQMYLASPEETGEKCYSFLWHPHTAPPQMVLLGRDDRGMFVDWHEGTQAREEGAIMAAITEDEAGTSFAEILIHSSVTKVTVHRYLQALQKEGRVVKVGHGKYRKAPLQ